MLLLDLSLRASAVTIIMMAFCLSLLQARHLIQGRISAVMCLSLAALILHTLPPKISLPAGINIIAWWLHGPALIFFWWFGLSLFDDDFRLRWYHWAVVGADYLLEIALPLVETHGTIEAFYVVFGFGQILNMSIMMHLFISALAGRKDDLVSTRRASRLFFILTAVLITLVLMNSEAIHYISIGKEEEVGWLSLLRAGLVLPISLLAFATFIRTEIDLTLLSAHPSPAVDRDISPRDQALYGKLLHLIEREKIYLEPGLSIGRLAKRMHVPEHQLRALINRRLGYRNFTTFLNNYRLAEAKSALADPEKARTSILRIANSAGYASLATFNRAFKSSEDITPREYRLAALDQLARTHSSAHFNPAATVSLDT